MVEIYRDNSHVEEVAEYIGSIPHEILVSVDKRVKRVYKID
jgi:alanine racemase